jgi:hypothetical protein
VRVFRISGRAIDRRKIEMVWYKAGARPALRAGPTITIVPASALNSNRG